MLARLPIPPICVLLLFLPTALGAAPAVSESDGAFWFTVAKMEAAEGQVPEAMEAFRKTMALAPEDPYVRLEYADLLSRTGRLRQAAEIADEARALAPDNADVLRLVGHVRLELASSDPGSLQEARRSFERLREIEPADTPSMLTLSRIYLGENEAEKAVDLLEEAISYAPGHPAVQRMLLEALMRAGDDGRALEILPRLLRMDPSFIEGRRALAQILGERGRHGEAIRLLDEAPAEDLREGDTLYLLASELYRRAVSGDARHSVRREDLERASALLDQIVDQQPTHLRALYLRALVLDEQSQRREAIEELRRLQEVAPQDLRLQVVTRLAGLLEEEGEVGEAASLLADLAEELRGSDDGGAMAERVWLEVARLHGRHQEWQALHAAAVKLINGSDQGLRREGFLLAAEALRHLDLPQQARDLLERGQEEFAEDPRLPLRRAEILAEAGRSREADAVLEELSASDDPATLFAIVQFHLSRGRHDDVVPLLEKVLGPTGKLEDAERRKTVLVLATSLIETSRAERALEMLAEEEPAFLGAPPLERKRLELKRAEALEALGRDGEAAELLGGVASGGDRQSTLLLAQYYEQHSRYEEMVPLLERAVAGSEIDGGAAAGVDLHFALGVAYERLGSYEAAAESFHRVLELDPDESNALNYLGYMWADRGEHLEEALELIRRAVELEPHNGAFLDSLGWVYYRLGRFEKARQYLERAARLLPEDATVLEHLGDLYVALDIPDKAREVYQRVLDINDENVEGVRRKLAQLEVGES